MEDVLQNIVMTDELFRLNMVLCGPPAPWVMFGTHVGQEDVRLEFWGKDQEGMPLWEKVVSNG